MKTDRMNVLRRLCAVAQRERLHDSAIRTLEKELAVNNDLTMDDKYELLERLAVLYNRSSMDEDRANEYKALHRIMELQGGTNFKIKVPYCMKLFGDYLHKLGMLDDALNSYRLALNSYVQVGIKGLEEELYTCIGRVEAEQKKIEDEDSRAKLRAGLIEDEAKKKRESEDKMVKDEEKMQKKSKTFIKKKTEEVEEPVRELEIEEIGRASNVSEPCWQRRETCIPNPNINFMHYSLGESTNYSTNIFKGKLAISKPSSTIDKETIHVMYFTMDEHVYEMSGFQWPNFSLRYPSEHILSVYGVGNTMDDQIFIACETLEQPLETWLEDRENFSIIDKPLSSTLKSFFKDVINGVTHVHKQSEGSLKAELAINNVFICNGRAKLGLLRQVEPTSDTIASFRRMVVKEVFKTEHEHIPVELMHLLDHMKKNKWHPTCVTHPVFFSASQTCIYAKLARERIQACEKRVRTQISWELNRAARTIEDLHFDKENWITRVKHEVLLMVLNKFKKDEVNSSGAGNDMEYGKTVEESVDEESDVPVEEKVEGDQVEVVGYVGSGYSFLEFFRKVVVHMKKGILTDEELVFEMNNILPNFLLCVYEVLTDNHVFVTVGEDFTLEEEERSA